MATTNILAGDAKKQQEENEYSRLIAAIGANTLKRLQATKILILGLRGVGLEVGTRLYREQHLRTSTHPHPS